jgi:hypothetical protein
MRPREYMHGNIWKKNVKELPESSHVGMSMMIYYIQRSLASFQRNFLKAE